MKCGTTSLYRYLALHPQIAMSQRKELDFFKTDADFAKGLEWYSAQFPDDSGVRGEASPNYSKFHIFPGVPDRMRSVLPDIKLIYLVRNPVERAVSHYMHSVHGGLFESRPISAVFERLDENNYVPGGGVHEATVAVVDRVVDAASATFGVRLELPNPNYALPGGLRCDIRFLPR